MEIARTRNIYSPQTSKGWRHWYFEDGERVFITERRWYQLLGAGATWVHWDESNNGED